MPSYNYLKIIYKENPIEIAKYSYFKIIYKENPIEMEILTIGLNILLFLHKNHLQRKSY